MYNAPRYTPCMYGWMDEKQIICKYKLCILCSVTFLCCLGRVISITCDIGHLGRVLLVMTDAIGVLLIDSLHKVIFIIKREWNKVLLSSPNSKYMV